MSVGWGILGCGDVCERKSGPAFQKATGSRLVAVMRRNRALAEDFARRHGVPRFYDDADALVNDREVDAVYIATPPGTHVEHALRVCRAGKPAYVEKPMARSYHECLTMIRAFEEARVPLFVAYYRRGLDRFRVARDLVGSGRLGTVTGVVYRHSAPHHVGLDPRALPWRVVAEHSGGGLLLDVEDTVAMSFVTPDGVPGAAHWSFATDVRAERIDIVATDGELSMPTFGDEPTVLTVSGKTETLEFPNPYHIQQPMIQSVVDALQGKGHCPSAGVDASRTSAVMDQVLTSYYGPRDVDFWRTPEKWPGRRRSPLAGRASE
jgi:1,5-anhydro-D-fructose reductase (1,5-anhydro-D-mannitol-forming)